MKQRVRFRGCRSSWHRGIGLVAHIVIAGDMARINFVRAQLIARLGHRAFEIWRVRIFLNQVAEVNDHIGPNSRDLLQRNRNAPRLLAPRFKLERAFANVEHVMRIRDHNAFELGRWKVGFVDHRLGIIGTDAGDCPCDGEEALITDH